MSYYGDPNAIRICDTIHPPQAPPFTIIHLSYVSFTIQGFNLQKANSTRGMAKISLPTQQPMPAYHKEVKRTTKGSSLSVIRDHVL